MPKTNEREKKIQKILRADSSPESKAHQLADAILSSTKEREQGLTLRDAIKKLVGQHESRAPESVALPDGKAVIGSLYDYMDEADLEWLQQSIQPDYRSRVVRNVRNMRKAAGISPTEAYSDNYGVRRARSALDALGPEPEPRGKPVPLPEKHPRFLTEEDYAEPMASMRNQLQVQDQPWYNKSIVHELLKKRQLRKAKPK